MKKRPQIKIGICGLGVVGQGVWKHLERSGGELEKRLGAALVLHRASVRDVNKPRDVFVPPEKLTSDAMAVATDPEVQIVCELIGGTTIARDVTLAALSRGKIVVSANKALLCQSGPEIFAAARKGGGHFFFEASVAGGIPIIKALREGLVANRFRLIYGILNGTCNYILTRMEREGLSYQEIVADAKRLGYAEADESLDVQGWDTAHKASILSFLAHGRWVKPEEMLVEGIDKICQADIRQAEALGYSIKLLAIISRDFAANEIFVRVHPTLISRRKVLANVNDVYNGISVSGDVVGTTLYIGRGAGQDATASAVISDLADAAILLSGGKALLLPDEAEEIHAVGNGCTIAPLERVVSRYYLRMNVKDAPGVLAQVASLMAKNEVSIASVLQRESEQPEAATLILTTHHSNERAMRRTLAELQELPSVLEAPLLLRIGDFEE